MRDGDRVKFVATLTGLAAVKPGKGLTPEAIEIWWAAMRSWSIEDFNTAAAHLALAVEFMPSPYHFDQLRKVGKLTAAEAWARAIAHASSGAWRRGPCGDETVDLVVRCLGGYQAIGLCDIEKLHFLERRFCEHFETLEDRVEKRRALPELARKASPALPPAAVSNLLELRR